MDGFVKSGDVIGDKKNIFAEFEVLDFFGNMNEKEKYAIESYNIKFHHSHVFLILSIKLLNVNLEKILKSEQFLTDKGNLLNTFPASSWNVPDSIGIAKDIPDF